MCGCVCVVHEDCFLDLHVRIGTFACVCTVHVQRLGIMSVLLAWSLWSEGWVVGALRSKVVALIVWHGMVCGGVDGRLEVLYSTYVSRCGVDAVLTSYTVESQVRWASGREQANGRVLCIEVESGVRK